MKKSVKQRDIDEFVNLLTAGLDSWIKAGLKYVEMLERDPAVADAIVKAHPHISRSILARFEQIGRKQVHPRLLLAENYGYRKLRSMPYSVQLQYLDKPVTVYEPVGDTHRLVHISKMSKEVAAQVFASDHVRDETEQKAYIEAVRALQAVKDASSDDAVYTTPWEVRRNKLFIKSACTMTKQELVAILGAMV